MGRHGVLAGHIPRATLGTGDMRAKEVMEAELADGKSAPGARGER